MLGLLSPPNSASARIRSGITVHAEELTVAEVDENSPSTDLIRFRLHTFPTVSTGLLSPHTSALRSNRSSQRSG